MNEPYKIVHLLGSVKNNEGIFRYIELKLTNMGYIVFAPVIYDYDIYKQNKEMIDEMCEQKLNMSDFCVVVNPQHIGESTRKRIEQCFILNKAVYFWQNGHLTLINEYDWYNILKKDD